MSPAAGQTGPARALPEGRLLEEQYEMVEVRVVGVGPLVLPRKWWLVGHGCVSYCATGAVIIRPPKGGLR